MKEEMNNSKNGFSELKNLLKTLPKVNTPNDFEFKLMTKIQNQNFAADIKKKKSWLYWSLTPAIAFAATVFIIFFLVGLNDSPQDAGLTPKLINENTAEIQAPIDNINSEDNRSDKINRAFDHKNVANNTNGESLPFDKNSSLDLDDYLNSDYSSANQSRSRLATSQTSSSLPFDGFFLREIEKQGKKDSLNKSDSLSLKNNK